MRKFFASLLCLGLLCVLPGCGPADGGQLAPPVAATSAPAVAPVSSTGTDYTGAAVAAGAGFLLGRATARREAPAPVVQHVTVNKTVTAPPRTSGVRARSFSFGGRRGR